MELDGIIDEKPILVNISITNLRVGHRSIKADEMAVRHSSIPSSFPN